MSWNLLVVQALNGLQQYGVLLLYASPFRRQPAAFFNSPPHTRIDYSYGPVGTIRVNSSKYSPAKPGALVCEPLKAASGVGNAAPSS